jgi:hypothetical protein
VLRFGIKDVARHKKRNVQAGVKTTVCPGDGAEPHVLGIENKYPGPP